MRTSPHIEIQTHWREWERRRLRQTLVILTVLNVFLQCLGMRLDQATLPATVGRDLIFWRSLQITLALAIGLMALFLGKHAKFTSLLAGALALCLPAGAFIWHAQSVYLANGFEFGSISGFKFLPLLVAAVNWGSPALGFAFVAAAGLETAAFWFYFGLSNRIHPVMFNEPLNTIAFIVSALGICYLRYVANTTTRELFITRARNLALSQINKMLMNLQDQANSPLQTLELGLSVHPEENPAEILSAMRSALRRLRGLHEDLKNGTEFKNEIELN